MIRIEDFRNERESSASAHFQFLLNLRNRPNSDIHVFFEGRDDRSFYMNFLYKYSNTRKIYTYLCKNKRGVYETYRKTLNTPYHVMTLFFVDKDHSDILNEEWEQVSNIYVTDFYSIENYLVSAYMLERVWLEIFRFSSTMEFDDMYQTKFEEELNRFYQFTTPLMAWVICLKRQGKSPIINNISISRFFNITKELTIEWNEEVQNIGVNALLENICREQSSEGIEVEIKRTIENELLNLNVKSYIRGKLELDFFMGFISILLGFLNRTIPLDKGSNGSKPNLVSAKTQLTKENAIEILGPRALIPQSLEKFLQMQFSFPFRDLSANELTDDT